MDEEVALADEATRATMAEAISGMEWHLYWDFGPMTVESVAPPELERLAVHVQFELTAQHHQHLVGARRVRLGGVLRAGREAELVELDER